MNIPHPMFPLAPDEERRYLAMLSRITLKYPLYNTMRIDFDATTKGIVMRIYGHVPDRDNGKIVRAASDYFFTPDMLRHHEFEFFVHVVRRKIIEAMQHELDEMLCVDGVRVWDPHDAP